MSVYRPKGKETFIYDFWRAGRRFSGDTGCTEESKARTAEAKRIKEAERWAKTQHATRAAFRGEAPLTMQTATDRYWVEAGIHHAGAATTLVDLKRAVDRFGAQTRLDAITDSDVAAYVAARRGERVRGKKKDRPFVAPATVNRTTVDLLRKLFTRARKAWKIALPHEPDWKLHRIKERGELVRELKTDDEARIAAAMGEGYRDLWRFALTSGLRLGECFLTWSCIDWQAATISVVQKGGRPHTIPMAREVAAIIGTCRGHHDEYVFTYVARRTRKPKWKDDPDARIKGRRYPVTYEGMKSEWAQVANDLKLDLRFHDMRHTKATRLLRRTGNLKAVQKLLGHADIDTTSRFYAHVTMDDLRDLLDISEASQSRPISKKKGGRK